MNKVPDPSGVAGRPHPDTCLPMPLSPTHCLPIADLAEPRPIHPSPTMLFSPDVTQPCPVTSTSKRGVPSFSRDLMNPQKCHVTTRPTRTAHPAVPPQAKLMIPLRERLSDATGQPRLVRQPLASGLGAAARTGAGYGHASAQQAACAGVGCFAGRTPGWFFWVFSSLSCHPAPRGPARWA